jgi:hypothetical protein
MLRGLVLLIALGLSFGARAQDAGGDAVRSVISRQIDAFKADDFATAFEFASPAIKGIFGSPEQFGAMVRQGYPMVWRPGDVRFSSLRQEGGRTVQSVLVTDQAGSLFVLEYEMVPGPNGWQINGVTVRRSDDAAA